MEKKEDRKIVFEICTECQCKYSITNGRVGYFVCDDCSKTEKFYEHNNSTWGKEEIAFTEENDNGNRTRNYDAYHIFSYITDIYLALLK